MTLGAAEPGIARRNVTDGGPSPEPLLPVTFSGIVQYDIAVLNNTFDIIIRPLLLLLLLLFSFYHYTFFLILLLSSRYGNAVRGEGSAPRFRPLRPEYLPVEYLDDHSTILYYNPRVSPPPSPIVRISI